MKKSVITLGLGLFFSASQLLAGLRMSFSSEYIPSVGKVEVSVLDDRSILFSRNPNTCSLDQYGQAKNCTKMSVDFAERDVYVIDEQGAKTVYGISGVDHLRLVTEGTEMKLLVLKYGSVAEVHKLKMSF
jgi:hypothetical protein